MKAALAVIAIIVLGGAGWLVYDKNHNKTPATSTTPATSQTPAASSQTPAASTSGEVVVTKTDSKKGQYLSDANGMTLYTFSSDKSGVSNCSGSCLSAWPIYDASSPPAALPANVTVISRSDGKKQYAYNGMPLYTFTSDGQAGQVTGDGVAGFHLAKP